MFFFFSVSINSVATLTICPHLIEIIFSSTSSWERCSEWFAAQFDLNVVRETDVDVVVAVELSALCVCVCVSAPGSIITVKEVEE